MTEKEAKKLLKELSDYYKQPVLPVSEYCSKFYEWVDLYLKGGNDFHETPTISVEKSCLLDRLLYCGENPSQTPCPVHKGMWSGCHGPWPGQFLINLRSGEKYLANPDPVLQQWYDEGCRCFQHRCGCTTGWQPDEHCGCLKEND